MGLARLAELLGERRWPYVYGGPASWAALGLLGKPGEEENGRMRELQQKTKTATTK
jgi:hypothetical protein